MTAHITGALMDASTASTYLGISARTLEGWRARGIGPAYLRLSKTKGVRYRMEDVVAWMRTREHAR